MKSNKFSIKKRLQSFKYAFNGLNILIKQEHNARIHLFATVFVIVAGFIFDISIDEWIAVVFAIGLVIAMEIVNSAIEGITDFVSPDFHEKIKIIKDLAASAVLVSAITATIVGLIVFVPHIIALWG